VFFSGTSVSFFSESFLACFVLARVDSSHRHHGHGELLSSNQYLSHCRLPGSGLTNGIGPDDLEIESKASSFFG
jgi:hypothetical protein